MPGLPRQRASDASSGSGASGGAGRGGTSRALSDSAAAASPGLSSLLAAARRGRAGAHGALHRDGSAGSASGSGGARSAASAVRAPRSPSPVRMSASMSHSPKPGSPTAPALPTSSRAGSGRDSGSGYGRSSGDGGGRTSGMAGYAAASRLAARMFGEMDGKADAEVRKEPEDAASMSADALARAAMGIARARLGVAGSSSDSGVASQQSEPDITSPTSRQLGSIAAQTERDHVSLADQEAELEAEMERLRQRRTELAERRAQALRSRVQAANAQLKRLDEGIGEQRAAQREMRERLMRLRMAQAESARGDVEVEKEIVEMERDAQIERLARARMALNEMRQRKEKLDGAREYRALTLREIEAEKQERAVTSEQRLAAALRRVDVMAAELQSDDYSAKERQRLAQLMEKGVNTEGDDEESEESRYALRDELEQMRRRRRDERAREMRERTRQLNEQRIELLEREKKLAKEKRQLQAVRAKGRDFLVEMEMGQGPPLEYVVANLPPDAEGEARNVQQYEEEDDDVDLDRLVADVTIDLPIQERRLAEMKLKKQREFVLHKELAKPPHPPEPYDGSLSAESGVYRAGQEGSYRIARALAEEIVDRFVAEYVDEPAEVQRALLEKASAWGAARQRTQYRLAERSVEGAMRGFVDLLVEETILDIAEEAVGDERHFDELAANKVAALLLGAVMGKDASDERREKLERTLGDAQARRLARDTARRSTGPPVHLHTLQFNFTADDGLPEVKKGPRKTVHDDEEQEDAEPLYLQDLETVDMRPDVDPEDYAMEGERIYWQSMDLQPVFVPLSKSNNGIKKVSSLRASPDGKFLAAGTAYGAVGVYDLRQLAACPIDYDDELPLPPLLFSYTPSSKRPPVNSMDWSLDSSSTLCVCDEGHEVSIFAIKPDWMSQFKDVDAEAVRGSAHKHFKEISSRRDGEPPKKAQRLWRRMHLDAKKLRRKGVEEEKDGRTAAPVRVVMHPHMTLMGYQPSFVVGCANGLLVKWNLHHHLVRKAHMLHKNYPMYTRETNDEYLVQVLRNRRAARRKKRAAKGKGAPPVIAAPAGRRVSTVALAARVAPMLKIGESKRHAEDTEAIEGAAGERIGGGDGALGGDAGESESAVPQNVKVPSDFVPGMEPVIAGGPPSVPATEPLDPADGKVGGDAAVAVQDDDDDEDEFSSSRGPQYMMRADVPVVKREFFQGHTAPIVLVSFVNMPPEQTIPTPFGDPSDVNESHPEINMVTVDRAGHVFLWPYRTDEMGGFGWFAPAVKLRVDMRMPTFTPKPGAPTTVRFPPKGMITGLNPGKNPEFVKQSKRQELLLQPHVWSETPTANGGKVVVRHPPSRSVPEEGCPFDVVTYSSKGTLLKHESVVYMPAARAGTLVDACAAASGRELVFLILLPPAPPRIASLRIVVMDLVNRKLREKCYALPAIGKGTPFMRVTPVLDIPSSDYVYILMDNVVRVLSLGTGKPVVGALNVLRPDQTNVDVTALEVVGQHKFLSLAGPNLGVLYIYRIIDRSSADVRVHCATYCRSERRLLAPPECKVRTIRWDIAEGHARRAIEDIVEDIVDFALWKVERKATQAAKGGAGGQSRRKSRTGRRRSKMR